MKEVGELFDRKVHTKIKDFMDDTEKNLKFTMNSQAEMSGMLKNLKIWMKAQSTSLTKNVNNLKTYLCHQEKYQSNATYVPPPPKHRDPAQEYIKTHEDWNKTGDFVIKNSLTHHALTADFSAMAHCNETFAENDLVYIRRPIPKVEHFKMLKLCNYCTRDKICQNFNMKNALKFLTPVQQWIGRKVSKKKALRRLQYLL